MEKVEKVREGSSACDRFTHPSFFERGVQVRSLFLFPWFDIVNYIDRYSPKKKMWID